MKTASSASMNLPTGQLLFGVLSDLHLLDPALELPEGAARSALLRTALARFRDRGVDGVLVCGDLTNNGFVTELEEVARILDNFPDGVAFFGHTHSSLADEQSAWQGGFTAINAGGFVNAALPRGRENSTSISWLADDPAPFAQMPPVPAAAAHDAMLVAVDGWRLRVERLDIETGLPLGPDWDIETGPEAIARGAFGNAARAEAAGPPPQFPPDTAVSFEDVSDGANRKGDPTPQMRVRFPRAETQSGGLRAFDYRVRVETLAFGEPRLLLEKRVLTPGANRPEALDADPPCCVFSRAELAAPGPLRFTVAPANAWGQEGRALPATMHPNGDRLTGHRG